jgi:hypothetical protein
VFETKKAMKEISMITKEKRVTSRKYLRYSGLRKYGLKADKNLKTIARMIVEHEEGILQFEFVNSKGIKELDEVSSGVYEFELIPYEINKLSVYAHGAKGSYSIKKIIYLESDK